MGAKKWRRLREPSVFCPPYVASSPTACTTRTRDHSASSSSATAIGRAVRTPCPISDRCATIVTSPVWSMDTNAVGLKRGTSIAGAAGTLLADPCGSRRSPTTRPPATAAPPTRKRRRLRFSRIVAISCPSRRGLDRRANPLIGTAPADVAGHRLVDIVIGGLGCLREQAGGLHDLSALAVAALGDVQAAPRGHDAFADRRRVDRLDSRDFLALRGRDRRDTRARRRSVEVHRAGATERHAASELRAREPELITQHPEERHVGGNLETHRFAIDVELRHMDLSPFRRLFEVWMVPDYVMSHLETVRRSASDERVDRPCAGAVDEERDRHAKGENVVLHALGLLRAQPVHEEPVPLVNGDRHEHDDGDAERRDAREQADRQAERAEEFCHHRKERERRREARLREVRHSAPEAITAEPSERLLRAVREHDGGNGQPEDEWNNAAIRPDEPVDHDNLQKLSGVPG